MTLTFENLAGSAWRAYLDVTSLPFAADNTDRVYRIGIFVDDKGGNPEPTQLAAAQRIATDIAAVRAGGVDYLNLFVVRLKACGNANEEWWLDEIEMRGAHHAEPRCTLWFTLEGDDYGHWGVEMRILPDRFHPIRFERKQG